MLSVLLSLAPLVLLSCTLVLVIGWVSNLLKKRTEAFQGHLTFHRGTNIYTWGRPASLGEDALDYVSRRTGVNNITLAMTLDR